MENNTHCVALAEIMTRYDDTYTVKIQWRSQAFVWRELINFYTAVAYLGSSKNFTRRKQNNKKAINFLFIFKKYNLRLFSDFHRPIK